MAKITIPRPEEGEFAPFYADYIAAVPEGDVLALLVAQIGEADRLLGPLTDSQAAARYAPGKWSVKEVLGHLSDAERVFGYRLLRISRGDKTPLPGYEENDYVEAANFDRISWRDLLDEWKALRTATIALTRAVPAANWSMMGTANGRPVSARAIAYMIPGHMAHHLGVLRDRYGLGAENS